MSYLLLLAVIVCCTLENVVQKQYNISAKNHGAVLFGSLSSLTAMAVFFITASAPLRFDVSLLPYSLGFAAAYGTAIVCSVFAMRYGPLAITSLIIAYSLLIPTFYGILFLHDTPSVLFYIGVVLLMASLYLINYRKGQNDGQKVSLKWLIFVILAFIGNGMCSTVQTMFVNHGDANRKSEFMILALIVTCIAVLILSLITERHEIPTALKKGSGFALLYGILNGIVNFFVILLVGGGELPASVIYPSISAGGMVLAFLIATFFYKEKMRPMQTVGFFVGVASCVLLNL